jgi:hypothetical protein
METPKRKKMELDGMQNAGISAKERLGKIEDKIDIVLGKLDNKVDRVDFIEIEKRVREIELHGTTQTQGVIEQMKTIQTEYVKQNSELLKSQSKLKSSIAYIMGAGAGILIIVEILFKKG